MMDFLWYVWMGITRSMALDVRVAEFVDQYPQTGLVTLTIAILGGVGLLLGQSVILFVNRVSPGRFVLSLVINGVVFAISLLIWGIAIWAVGMFLFPAEPTLGLVLRLVALSAAPYVFGFLVLIPYLGEFVHRVLSVWSSVIAAGATAYSFRVNWWPAFLVVGLSWLAIWALSNTIGKPVLAARNRIWRAATGTRMDTTVADILNQFAAGDAEKQGEGKP
jgi:hypothetical protein